jgi:type I restriction enzyme S subunit
MEAYGGNNMVGNLAIKEVQPDIKLSEKSHDELKWCTVTLSDVVKAGKRLEATVFDIESKKAQTVLNDCIYPKINLIGSDQFVEKAHYGGRLKRNYISSTDENAIGFIGSSEMLDTKPAPVKFMASNAKNVDSLKVKKGTVLISRSGTIGNLTFVNETLSNLLVSEHAIRLECKHFPGYVYCFLKTKTGQSVIKSKIYGAVIQQIEPEHLADISVPNPPENIKIKINDLITRSFDLRDVSNELIDKATRLMISALELPPIEEFSTDKFNDKHEVDNFNVKLSQLSSRADASYHVPIVKAITQHLKAYAGEVTTVSDKRISKAIILPGRFKRVYVEEGKGRVFFGGRQLFELDPSNKKYLSNSKHNARICKELEILENTILITRSGTIGKVTITPKHWEHWIANEHIIRVVPANKDIAGYLSIFLASDYGYRLITRFTYGSVVDEIDDNHVSQIQIPLLKNRVTQDEINTLALQANQKRYEAYLLEQEAMDIINDEVIFAK